MQEKSKKEEGQGLAEVALFLVLVVISRSTAFRLSCAGEWQRRFPKRFAPPLPAAGFWRGHTGGAVWQLRVCDKVLAVSTGREVVYATSLFCV